MTYETAEALRMALEQRLLNQSKETGVSLERLRRRVVFERIIARLAYAEPGRWVLKGGMALEVRLRDDARLTRDIDLGLRGDIAGPAGLQERLVDALALDPFDDRFVLAPGVVDRLMEDGGGHVTWRSRVTARLAGRPFDSVQLDVSPRAHELDQTDTITISNGLDFAGFVAPTIEVVDLSRHAAEKFHGMVKDFGERENSRVRDLVDLVILCEHELLDPGPVAAAVTQVWRERDDLPPPIELPPFPSSWPDRYEQLAVDHDLNTRSFPLATATVEALWAEMFHSKET